MESLCQMDIILFQQVLTGKPKRTRTLLLLDTKGRDDDGTDRHRIRSWHAPLVELKPCNKRRGQTEKATPVPKEGDRPKRQPQYQIDLQRHPAWHGHSMTTGNYCIYGMNFSFPVSHPARLPLTTEIAHWSTIGPSPDRRNYTEPTCPLLDPVCLIRSVEPLLRSFGRSVGLLWQDRKSHCKSPVSLQAQGAMRITAYFAASLPRNRKYYSNFVFIQFSFSLF